MIESASRCGRPAFHGVLSSHPGPGVLRNHPSAPVLRSWRVTVSLRSSPLRADPLVSLTPAAFPGPLVIPEVCTRRPSLGRQGERPCFGSVFLPYVPPPLRREEEQGPQFPLATRGLPPQHTESAPLLLLTTVSVGALLTTLQYSRNATACRVARPPERVRPEALLRPPRTFTSELARGRSSRPRVGYHYTGLPGGRLCPGFHGLEYCRYRLHVLSQS